METLFRDPSFQPGFGVLIDRRAINRAADTDYIHQVVEFIERSGAQSGHARWAFLVGDLASFGMARMAHGKQQ